MRKVINLKLVFGLGNVGKEYINTRHNIGFMVLDNYLSYKFSDVIWKDKFNSFCYKCVIEEEDVIVQAADDAEALTWVPLREVYV